MSPAPHRKAGFTLVEMMIGVTIAMLAIAMSVSSFMTLTTASTSSAAYTRLHGELRHALDVIERDFRAGIRVVWMHEGYGSRIVLLIRTAAGDEHVYYYLSGSTLYRWMDGQIQQVAGGLSTVEFALLDASGAVTATLANAKSIDVTLTGSSRVLSKTCDDTVRTRIAMRNGDV
ncbi:MAG: hypothetical protein HN341_09535 [Verrucomicrobia bacterium]|jgi:hypothetical protein|nr:hypothetical protein [Verrucomicrobiota bacterium]